MPAALRHFRVVILTQIGVERNERVIEKIALDPDPRRTRLGCRDSYLIDATGVPLQRQLPGPAGFDPEPTLMNGGYPEIKFLRHNLIASANRCHRGRTVQDNHRYRHG